ncbi:MAG: hypothetical protein WCC12_09685 [Anaerolineales bacterium]
MSRNMHWSVQLAVLLGLIGLFVTSLSPWLGVLLILVGLVVPVVVLRQAKKPRPSTPRPKISQEPRDVSPRSLPARRVDRDKLGVLRYTLHQANLDSNAPLFQAGGGKPVTVRDILLEMIDIADALGRPIEALARDIVALYPHIFDHIDDALRRYSDADSAKTYIARKAMTDRGWRLDEEDLRNL